MSKRADNETASFLSRFSGLISRFRWASDTAKDGEIINRKEPVSTLYPSSTVLLATLTTFVIAFPIWVGLLIVDGVLFPELSPLLAVSLIELFVFPVYGNLVIGLAVGSGVATALWYVHFAPDDVSTHLSSGPLGMFLWTSLLGVFFYGLLVLGGWLANIVVLLGLIVVLLTLFAGGGGLFLYALAMRSSRLVAYSIGAIVAGLLIMAGTVVYETVVPRGLPIDFYVYLATYPLALVGIVYWPRMIVGYSLREYRSKRATVSQTTQQLTERREMLEERAPTGYPIDFDCDQYMPEQFDSEEEAQTTLEDELNRLEAYETHVSHWKEVQTGTGIASSDREFGRLAGTVLHPQKCRNGEIALDAAGVLDDLRRQQSRYVPSNDLPKYDATTLYQTLEELDSKTTIVDHDIRRLRKGVDAIDRWIDTYNEYQRLERRVKTLQSTFYQTLGVRGEDMPIDIESYKPSQDGTTQSSLAKLDRKLERYEALVPLAERVDELADQYPTASLPEALRALIRAQATGSRRSTPVPNAFVDKCEHALELASEYPAYQFENVTETLETMCENWSTADHGTVDTVVELLDSAEQILRFLETVDHAHPSVEAQLWTDAIETALANQYPKELRPIVAQIEGMEHGLWDIDDLFKYDWQAFEQLVGHLFEAKGYEVEVTQGTNDAGVDVWARGKGEAVAIQVKQNGIENTVGRRVLQQIVSTIAKGDADRAVVVTSSSFANTAIEYAHEFGTGLTLIDGETFAHELSESNVPPPN